MVYERDFNNSVQQDPTVKNICMVIITKLMNMVWKQIMKQCYVSRAGEVEGIFN